MKKTTENTQRVRRLLDRMVSFLNKTIFKKDWLKTSDYPNDFIPRGGKVFIGVDPASPDGDCTVKGFYKDGVFHLQEIEYSKDT